MSLLDLFGKLVLITGGVGAIGRDRKNLGRSWRQGGGE